MKKAISLYGSLAFPVLLVNAQTSSMSAQPQQGAGWGSLLLLGITILTILIVCLIIYCKKKRNKSQGTNYVICPKCGFTNDTDAQFCEHCGTNLRNNN